MIVLQERLKEQKRMREKVAQGRTPPSQRKEQYTPIEIDTGSDNVRMVDSTTDSESSGDGAFHHQSQSRTKKPLPPTPPVKPVHSHSSSTSEGETTPKRKQLPTPPAKKPPVAGKSKPTHTQPKREDTSSALAPTQSLIDRMNQPLPPTPGEDTQPTGRRFKSPSPSSQHSGPQAPQATGKALVKEILAKQGKGSTDVAEGKSGKKKQPIPVPKQRPPSKKSAADSSKPLPNVPPDAAEQLHEPAGYANLPAHDTPYQNMGFGPDASTPPQEPDTLYENIHKPVPNKKPKGGRTAGVQAQKGSGYVNVNKNGSGTGSSAGSEYQNITASRRPRP